MKNRLAVVVVASIVGLGACTTVGNSPATAPPITEAPTTTSTTVTTTTVLETTTTVDRIAEIQAIFQDLERRRLEAIYSGDVDTFVKLFADTPYLADSLAVFDLVEPGDTPSVDIEVLEVLRDDERCIAAFLRELVGGATEDSQPATIVLMPSPNGWAYAYAFVGREGWLCDGPHPLSD
ncbi:MAG: hypothetical protein V3S28_07225 [Acidimicrobiia bacterium]